MMDEVGVELGVKLDNVEDCRGVMSSSRESFVKGKI
jgi:hypothetical protein